MIATREIMVAGLADILALQRRPKTSGYWPVGNGSGLESQSAGTAGYHANVVDGDLSICGVENQTAQQSTVNTAGWEQVGTHVDCGASVLSAWWKVFATGDAAPNVTDSGDHQVGYVYSLRGLSKHRPIKSVAQTATAASSTSVTIPSVFVPPGGGLVVALVSSGTDALLTNGTFSNMVGDKGFISRLFDRTTTTGSGGGFGIFAGWIDSPGHTGPFTGTMSPASAQSVIAFVCK